MTQFPFPNFPQITEELLRIAKKKQSFLPIAFDYYRFSATAAVQFACIDTTSICWKKIPKFQLAIIRGNLVRIGKIAKVVIEQTHDGTSSDLALILNRSIMESAINLLWCLNSDTKSRFEKYIHSGVQADLKLRKTILNNISKNGFTKKIEKRMLDSLDRFANRSGFKWEEVPENKLGTVPILKNSPDNRFPDKG